MSLKKPAKLTAIIVAIATMVAVMGCEVFGYDTPIVGLSSGSWQTKESTDPLTGDKLISVKTNTRPNSFFGKLLSIFGPPSLTISCVQGGPSNNQIRTSIDWREAIGPPNLKRPVQSRFDGGEIQDSKWQTSQSGRQSNRTAAEGGYIAKIKAASVLAVRTTNSGGTPVTLVFNVNGFDTVYEALPEECT